MTTEEHLAQLQLDLQEALIAILQKSEKVVATDDAWQKIIYDCIERHLAMYGRPNWKVVVDPMTPEDRAANRSPKIWITEEPWIDINVVVEL